MNQFKIMSTFLFLLFSSITFGQAPQGYNDIENVASFKKMVTKTSDLTNSISSDFKQEKHLTMMEEVLVSKGRFLFKKENKVRWEYFDPIVYVIIINENHFTIDNDGKISEFDTESNKLFAEINNMIVMAIRGNFVDDPGFDASFYQNEKKYLVVLTPKNELLRNILTEIEIYFSKADVAVSEVKFIEPGEDFTKITFNNRKANIEIDDEQFKSE